VRITLLESDRSLLRSTQCAFLSIMAHVGVVCLAVFLTADGRRLPADQREARVFFLLPPDRMDARQRQNEVIQSGTPGGDLQNGTQVLGPPDNAPHVRVPAYGVGRGERHGARGRLPFGPTPFVPDSIFSVLDVEEMVERYEGSAAPVYPRDLLAVGAEGLVQTKYVVDSTGRVDTTTIQVMRSDDPRFTESVRTALGGMRFHPAKRGGKSVSQLVEQRFRFRIVRPPRVADRTS
jgi:TonB family protein